MAEPPPYATSAVEVVRLPGVGPERDRVYAAMADAFPQFGDYQEKTTRKIPVIALDRS